MADRGRQALFAIGDRLHKTIGEVEAMPFEDVVETLAWIQVAHTLKD
jgi:hypothetical protein